MKKFALSALIMVLTLPALAGFAADGDWRKNAPSLAEPGHFKLPKIEKFKLANGLAVELVEDHRVPFTTLVLGIKAGGAREGKDKIGVASLTAEMLQEGAAGQCSKHIAEEVDFMGGALSASAGADFTILSASALSKYSERLFKVLSEVLLQPDFPENELKLAKTNSIQELTVRRNKPEFLVDEKFSQVVFGDHPYATVAPRPEDIERIDRAALVAFHKANYVPNEAVLIVVGDFRPEQMRTLVESSFSKWTPGQLKGQEIAQAPKHVGRKIYLVDRPGSVQSAVKVGNIGMKRSSPDYFSMLLANQVLGGAAASRLFMNLREDKGYTYGAYSHNVARREPGAFSAEAQVRNDVTAPSVKEFLAELTKIRTQKVADAELESAKKFLVGSFQLGLETQNGLAQRLLEGELYDLPSDYLETYAQRIMAVNADEVSRVAKNNIDLDNLVVTVVGDAQKVRPDLEKIAPLSEYDAAGKLVKGSAKAGNAGG